jgi:thiol-disulfide isomerase/thioredoxin
MRSFFALGIILCAFVFTFGQNEQSPIVEKEISYKDWKYKDIRTDKDVDLRDFAKGKKLTMVVYFAPWCHNFQHDAPMLERLYEQYKDNGLNVIAVGEYDPVASMRTTFDNFKLTFPAVYESENKDKRQYTLHYSYRQSTGDTRNWGSPWYIFLTPSVMEKKGDVITKKTFVINGEMIETEGEAFIRKNLGLPALPAKPLTVDTGKAESSKKIEACNDSVKPLDIVASPDAKKP